SSWKRPDGRENVYEWSAIRVSVGGKNRLFGMDRDITDRERAERQLEQYADQLAELNAELERSNRELQDFTHTVSHDLQEPLRKIHTFGQFLAEDCGDDLPEEGLEHLRRMQDAAVRMKRLIRHLLDLARVGSHGGEMVPVDSSRVLAETVEVLSQAIEDSGATVEVQGELPPVVADEVQLAQIFQNLISNALKFRSPDREPHVEISAERDGQMAVFSVTDNGIGVEERFLEKIFGVFQRLYPRDRYEGAGVGLALCRKIVTRHGGKIWAESVHGEGTTIYFKLPAAHGRVEDNETQ
ncbi:MAG: ATP-binding protein, partial [Candidatus Brocadiia bacterium]